MRQLPLLARTRATILRDLGVMQFRGGDKAAAQKSFADALALQPDLALGADYEAPEVHAAFDAARAGGRRRPASRRPVTSTLRRPSRR